MIKRLHYTKNSLANLHKKWLLMETQYAGSSATGVLALGNDRVQSVEEDLIYSDKEQLEEPFILADERDIFDLIENSEKAVKGTKILYGIFKTPSIAPMHPSKYGNSLRLFDI